MRSPNHPDERDLDVAGLRRTMPQTTAARKDAGGRRGRKGIGRYVLGGLVALVLALFGGVIWFAYQDLMPGGDEAPPLIRADATPIKRDPDERGGLPLVNEESAVVQALDEPDSPVRVERILPRETAAPRSTADIIPEVLEVEPRSDTDLPLARAPLDREPGADDGRAQAPSDTLDTLLAEIVDGQDAAGLIEPAAGPVDPADERADDALPLPADGIAPPERDLAALATPVSQPSAIPAPAATAAPTQAAAPTQLPAVPAPSAQPPATQPPAAQLPAIQPPAAQTPVPQAPVAQVPAAAPPPAGQPAETTVAALPQPALAPDFRGAFGVQLLAVRDEAAAAGAWSGLQRQHPAVLGPLRSRVQRAEIGGSTFYRLQAGPFVDRAGANAVCAALQARGTDCFIVEPTS